MGCVSSHLLSQDDDFTTTTLSHHIVSLTSSTYGLLTLDPSSSPTTIPPSPEVINTWELMDGLDSNNDSFRFSPQPSKPSPFRYTLLDKDQEKLNPKPIFNQDFQENKNLCQKDPCFHKDPVFLQKKLGPCEKDSFLLQNDSNPCQKDPNFKKKLDLDVKDSIFSQKKLGPCEKDAKLVEIASPYHKDSIFFPGNLSYSTKDVFLSKTRIAKSSFLDGFEELCPPDGEEKVVIYTTSLRGVRRTFEACNAVRAVLDGFGLFYCEKDISMDRGFRDELWELMKGKEKAEMVPPRVFVKGRYVGGVEECLRIVEDGYLGELLEGLPKSKAGYVCEVCGGARFLPCFECSGSCKTVKVLEKEVDGERVGSPVTVKCTDCNENGLVRCTNCS
nr:putative thioredoxin-like fold protein [Tanacetum cinerariifolium]